MHEVMQKYISYAMIPYKLSRCVDYCNIRDEWNLFNEWNSSIVDIENLINEVLSDSTELAERIQYIGSRVHDNIRNYMLCASIIEEELIPLICDVIKGIESDLPNSEGYELIKSKSGLLTMQNKRSGKLIHSMNNPMVEAIRQAEYLYKAEAEDILVCGAGLGYLAYQLWIKSCKSVHVYILEKDYECLKLAKEYGVLDWIDEESITVICESNEGNLFDSLYALPIDFDKSICWISDYFIDDIKDDNILAAILNFSENIITRERFRLMESVNIRCNKSNTVGDISELRENIISSNKEFIVIAAGPSLDDNIEYVKNNNGKKIIIAVESALKALLKNGINPDYVVVLDPTELIMKYISGIEDKTSDIVLIAYEKAYWKYVESFCGVKYRIVANSEADAEDIHKAVEDCTTVSSLAINVALFLGAKSIELIGLDLAFPNNKLYSNQISDINKISTEAMVRSVDGSMVATSNIFIQFKNEIEDIIRKSKAKFYNLSQSGAYIQGTLMDKWWEKNPGDFEKYLELLSKDTVLDWDEKYYILWQVICCYLNNNCESESLFWSKTSHVFENISQHFLCQLTEINKNDFVNEKYVILLTSYFSNDPDEISDKVRNDAYNLKTNHGFEVLIVNTGEYMGGKKVALEEWGEAFIPKPVINSDVIFCLGERIPYFEFEEGMPDVMQVQSFIDAISKKLPISFISYDPFSLVASACKLIGNVEYR